MFLETLECCGRKGDGVARRSRLGAAAPGQPHAQLPQPGAYWPNLGDTSRRTSVWEATCHKVLQTHCQFLPEHRTLAEKPRRSPRLVALRRPVLPGRGLQQTPVSSTLETCDTRVS